MDVNEFSGLKQILQISNQYDVIVIGAGAAGLMSAWTAGARGKSVLLIEHTSKIGEKIRISGGGRCNFTNKQVDSENFICSNKHFVKSALAQYSVRDFIALIEKHKIAYHEKTLGQLFCDGSSKQIIKMFEDLCLNANVKFKLNCHVSSIQLNDHYILQTNEGIFQTNNLIIASGGLSIPKIGASSFGYDIAKQFGLTLKTTKPALVPLMCSAQDLQKFEELRGTANYSTVSANHTAFKENILFTHRGLSGPSILQISSYLSDDFNSKIKINLLPEYDLYHYYTENREQRNNLASFLKKHMTNRFVKFLTTEQPDLEKNLTDLSKLRFNIIAKYIHEFEVDIINSEGYNKAEVTGGGVDTKYINAKTMECKHLPGLYFVGEVLDVTGWLGGYNFQWAWSSGFVAGSNIH